LAISVNSSKGSTGLQGVPTLGSFVTPDGCILLKGVP
jgi:hypothetical protein